jgi:hypothetical protein
MITFFAALFPPIVGFLIARGASDKTHIYTAAQYATGLILMPLFYALSLIFSLFLIKETYCCSPTRSPQSPLLT